MTSKIAEIVSNMLALGLTFEIGPHIDCAGFYCHIRNEKTPPDKDHPGYCDECEVSTPFWQAAGHGHTPGEAIDMMLRMFKGEKVRVPKPSEFGADPEHDPQYL